MDSQSPFSSDSTLSMDALLCPSAVLNATKPVKKRKSWGQELPEPKTSLPPRKRAKTDDEKEQRRIERIKRNRAAAHMSRERKRVEAEQLAVANTNLFQQMRLLQQQIAFQQAQLEKCKEQLGGVLPDISAEEAAILQSSSSSYATPSTYTSSPPTKDLPMIPTPETSPNSTPYTKLEDSFSESFQDEVPLFGAVDLTQHSAAMLCDLQCRSTAPNSQASLHLTSRAWFWSQLFLSLMQLSITNLYKTSLMALWMDSPGRMNRLLAAISARGSISTTRPRRKIGSSLTPSPKWSTQAQHSLLATGTSRDSSVSTLSGAGNGDQSTSAAVSQSPLQLHSQGHRDGACRARPEGTDVP